MVNDHLDNERKLVAMGLLYVHSTHRLAYAIAVVTPVLEHWLEWEIAQWALKMNNSIVKSDQLLIAYRFCIKMIINTKNTHQQNITFKNSSTFQAVNSFYTNSKNFSGLKHLKKTFCRVYQDACKPWNWPLMSNGKITRNKKILNDS